MTTATLVRTHLGADRRAGEDYETETRVEVLLEGDLADVIAAARAIPAAERLEVTIETENAHYGPDLFDSLSPDDLPLTDFDLNEGRSIVRIEKGALELLRGDRRMMPPMSIIGDQIEVITAILKYKKTVEDVEEVGGQRIIRITAADVEAA